LLYYSHIQVGKKQLNLNCFNMRVSPLYKLQIIAKIRERDQDIKRAVDRETGPTQNKTDASAVNSISKYDKQALQVYSIIANTYCYQ
jgi:hypothetical protein